MPQRPEAKELFVAIVVKVCVMATLFYLYSDYHLPIGLLGSLFGFIFILLLTVQRYSSMNLPQKAGSIGLTCSFLILSAMFTIKHFVSDIRISQLHIGVIIMAPLLIMRYMNKREGDD